MLEAEKVSRKILYAIGSAFIVFGFLWLIMVLFASPWLLQLLGIMNITGWYFIGILLGVLLIFLGIKVSNKARGYARVNGLLLNDEQMNRREKVKHE